MTRIDVQRLVGGANVPIETFRVAKDAYALVIVLSNSYLWSEACITELLSAMLYRRDQSQFTIVYAPDPYLKDDCDKPFVKRAIDHFSSVLPSSHIIRDGQDLLKVLAKHVYRCNIPHFSAERNSVITAHAENDIDDRLCFMSDTSRLTKFYAEFSEPEISLRRELRLPPTEVRKVQPFVLQHFSPRFLPKGSIRLGQVFISPDGSEINSCNGISDEHVLFFFCMLTTAIMLSLLNLNCFSINKDSITCSTYFYAGFNIIVAACSLVCLSIVISVHVDLDPRNYHDSILLPLNAAAFVSRGLKKNICVSHRSGDII